MRKFLNILLLVLTLGTCLLAEAADEVSGHVVDTSGAAIENARVQSSCRATEHTATSDGSGFFKILAPGKGCTLVISAPGFQNQTLPAEESITVKLRPLGSSQSVTVTASRSTLASSDLPVTAFVKTDRQLQTAPALTLDDKLRQVPGFALFRRSGSQTANPTSQGVSLRGLGASGASRSLVLADGVPLNDPFGGWVYWGRVPVESIEQVDIVEGGVSDLYGSNALGGVINIREHEELQTAFSGQSSYGSMNSPLGSVFATVVRGQWSGTIAAEDFATDGYVPVASQRGAIDRNANSEHQSGAVRIERTFAKHSRVFIGGNLYGESRRNGTVLQLNEATVRQLESGADWSSAHLGSFALRLYGGTENLHQTFSSINATRSLETLTVDQRVPVSQYGFSAQWSKTLGRHLLTAGADGRDVTGDTNEQQYTMGRYAAHLIAGGRQQTVGGFLEDVWQVTPHWVLSGSVRGDRWSNSDANSRRIPVAGNVTITPFANRAETAVSPRIGVSRVVTQRVTLYGSAYRSFRAPTLNELYRSFRVGNVLTQANSALKAEHFTGGEFGFRVRLAERLQVRATVFGGFLDDPVGNVTLSTTPLLITRQRQNIGAIRQRGLELAGDTRITKAVFISAAYQFTDATVFSNSANPALAGKLVPLIPRHAVTFAGTFAKQRWLTFSLQGRSNSTEYDDDQNTLPLDPYFNLGVYLERSIRSGLQLFGAVENLLNSTYTIGRTPVPTVAAPISLRIGLRFSAGALHRTS